jgi:hypothetical protein
VSRARVSPSRRPSSQAVKCRPASLNDYEQIHALERRYNLGFRSYEEWSHMWVNNPVCKQAPDLPIGWVLEDSQNQIVGSIGSVPFRFELNGRPLIAGTSSGWVADERYRAYALLLLDRFLSQPDVDLHLCVSPNGEAQPAVALQCERVPVGTWDRAGFWITDYWGFVGSALAKREVRFRALLRYPVWTAMVLHDAFRRDALRTALRKGRDHDVRICTAFDDRFDEFWETVRARNPHRLLASRSREVLAWHFKHPLARNVAWVATVCDSGRLAAYAVFCRKDVASIGLRRVRLLDYQSLDGDTSLLLPMLAETIERCRREGTSVLESIGWRLDSGDLMAKLAPYVRTMPSWQYFYKAATPALASALKERAVWNPSQYDGDACI